MKGGNMKKCNLCKWFKREIKTNPEIFVCQGIQEKCEQLKLFRLSEVPVIL